VRHSASALCVLALKDGAFRGKPVNRGPVSGYLSSDAVIPLMPPKRAKQILPLIAGGCKRIFETRNALDYGQPEVGDYWNANPAQHNVFSRVVWLVGVPD